jgi:hypothetical protein
MAAGGGEAVLVVESRPFKRDDWIGLAIVFGLAMLFCAGISVAACVRTWHEGPSSVIPMVLAGLFLVGIWPALILAIVFGSTRGTWSIDSDGVAFQPLRGNRVAVRWKEIERVRWGAQFIALRDRRSTVKIPLNDIEEPARSAVQHRLETTLKSDFDLAFRQIPDSLDAVEPPWWNKTLRVTRVVVVSAVVTAAMMGSMFWVVTRYPRAGSWQGQAVFFGWYGVLTLILARQVLVLHKLNPTWRRRRGKPVLDEIDDFR